MFPFISSTSPENQGLRVGYGKLARSAAQLIGHGTFAETGHRDYGRELGGGNPLANLQPAYARLVADFQAV